MDSARGKNKDSNTLSVLDKKKNETPAKKEPAQSPNVKAKLREFQSMQNNQSVASSTMS